MEAPDRRTGGHSGGAENRRPELKLGAQTNSREKRRETGGKRDGEAAERIYMWKWRARRV